MADVIVQLPEELYVRLDVKSARAGLSIGDYLLAVFERAAVDPTPADARERLAALPPWPTAAIVAPPEDDE
jgi:hypothetical protein